VRAVATTLKPLKPLIKRKLINVYRNQVNSWKIFKKFLSFYFQSAYQVTMSNMKEKMMLFNKPKVDEKEHMIQQRKKASFNSKCAKFEGTKEPILIKKDSSTKLKAKFFENGEEDKDLVKEEEEKLRKESFQKAKVIFQENPGKEDESEENGSLENGDDENEDELDTTETDQARRKAEFEAKQKLFSSQ